MEEQVGMVEQKPEMTMKGLIIVPKGREKLNNMRL